MPTTSMPGRPLRAVCVEVVAVRGSTPRETGARMLVHPQGEQGSIGGGHLEWLAMQRARRLLGQWHAQPAAAAAQEETHALGPSLGQCCGGAVTLRYQPWFEDTLPSPAPLFHLQLHGAGHVGRALVRLLATLPCTVCWVDVRDGAFPPAEPAGRQGQARIERIAVDSPEAEVGLAPPGAFYLVMTHSHALDAQICEAVLRRGDFGFLGLIGSHSKRASFTRRWRQRGLDEAALARLTCPVGVAGIAGKQPEVIALAVAAQLMQLACRAPSRNATPTSRQGAETSRARA